MAGASPVAQWLRIHLPGQETWVRFLGQQYPLEKEMATHFSTLAWETPWIEESGGLQVHEVVKELGQDLVTKQQHYMASTILCIGDALVKKSRQTNILSL